LWSFKKELDSVYEVDVMKHKKFCEYNKKTLAFSQKIRYYIDVRLFGNVFLNRKGVCVYDVRY